MTDQCPETPRVPCDNEGCTRTASREFFVEKDRELFKADLCQECFDGVLVELRKMSAEANGALS